MESDHYSTLQVDPVAEQEVIDAAYRRLAAKYHPDVNRSADAVERMKRMNAAYDVLSDPVKRGAYDRSRRRGGEPPGGLPRAGDAWRSRVRALLIPIGLVVFMLLASRVGVRPAFVVAAVLVALSYYWLTRPTRGDD